MNNILDRKLFARIEKEVTAVVNRISSTYEFEDKSRLDVVQEYLDYGEWGLALDMIIYILDEEEIEITRSDFESIGFANYIMGIPDEKWRFIEELVDDSL